jgi:hypothetical protein
MRTVVESGIFVIDLTGLKTIDVDEFTVVVEVVVVVCEYSEPGVELVCVSLVSVSIVVVVSVSISIFADAVPGSNPKNIQIMSVIIGILTLCFM